ncbi:MAG: hypothetical protein JNM90_08940 [Burkholderiales bacterium]|nr:hypothetical protein [Burkholderiales bacterium]
MTTDQDRPAGSGTHLDLARVQRLVADLEAEVARASPDEPGIDDLREEVLTLKSLIESPRPRHHWVADGLHAVREAAQAVRGEVVRESVYLTEIGRILGL